MVVFVLQIEDLVMDDTPVSATHERRVGWIGIRVEGKRKHERPRWEAGLTLEVDLTD